MAWSRYQNKNNSFSVAQKTRQGVWLVVLCLMVMDLSCVEQEPLMVQILKAQLEDLYPILQLQYLAYQSEALLHNNFTIHPLTQTLDELIEEYHKGIILKAVQNNEIIGSIRAYADNTTTYIGKLMVHPTHQGKGLGKRLLTEIENLLQRKRYELFTSYKSKRNLHIYKTSGYTQFREEINLGIKFLYLEKQTM